MSGPESVVAHARKMVGVPWRHQSHKPWAVDCIGLVRVCLRAAGWTRQIDVPARYGREPWDDRLRRGLRAHFGAPVAGEWQIGDIPLIRWNQGDPTHVGILANYTYGGHSIIHASRFRGVIETGLCGRIGDGVIEVYRPDWSQA